MSLPHCHPSTAAIIAHLRERFSQVPFLALGQTALWDEPTKAVWRSLLDTLYPDAEMVAGVHDTDYFAKTAAQVGSDTLYIALPHDDGRTRDLWSAAGELSSLFGSESVPTRAMFEAHNVPFNALAKADPEGREAFVARETAAWGWRGLVSTRSHAVIAHDIPILEIKDALLEQMDWGFSESFSCLAEGAVKDKARQTAMAVRGWVEGFLETCDDNCRLSDLYQTLLPRFYSLLLQTSPARFSTTSSLRLFQFNSATYSLPRFGILQVFVNPATRTRACAAYDRAVAGSGIYTLDGFGPGSVPFDIVVPSGGRGTLRLTGAGVWVETAGKPTRVSDMPVSTVAELAQTIEAYFGPEATLVGKAVTLVDMVAAEFLVLFHETASGYTPLTRKMNDALAQIAPLSLFPIVRLSYPTWDALSAVSESVAFQLPPHLSASFGAETVSAPEFARRWRKVVQEQKELLVHMNGLHRPRDLFAFLEGKDAICWCDREGEYDKALSVLKTVAGQSVTLAAREAKHRQEWDLWRQERQSLETRSGEDWRASILPLREKIAVLRERGADSGSLEREMERQLARREEIFIEPLRINKERTDTTRILLARFRRERRRLERGPEAIAARETLRHLLQEAQRAKMRLVRNAFLTVEGLEHTQARPTAWWLPLVDSSGAWWNAITVGTEARLEPLLSE